MTVYDTPLQTLHALWAADSILNGLLPASRVTTGRGKLPTVQASFPYGVITSPDERPDTQSSSTFYDRETLRIQVWTQSYAQGRPIHDRIRQVFRNQDFLLTYGSVINLHLESRGIIEELDDPTERIWQFVTDLSARVTTPHSSSGA